MAHFWHTAWGGSLDTLEAIARQTAREQDWVVEGVTRFRTHLDTADPGATPAGKAIMRRSVGALAASIRDNVPSGERPMGDPLLPVVSLLGPDHVAAVTLRALLPVLLAAPRESRPGDPSARSMVSKAKAVGDALEHDIRFRLWAKDAQGAERDAVNRMRRKIEGDPSTWRKRARALRVLAQEAWTPEASILVGVALIKLLADACPETFEAPVVRYGGKTMRLLRLTDDAAEALTNLTDAAALSTPRFGMMVIPPRPWRYTEPTS